MYDVILSPTAIYDLSNKLLWICHYSPLKKHVRNTKSNRPDFFSLTFFNCLFSSSMEFKLGWSWQPVFCRNNVNLGSAVDVNTAVLNDALSKQDIESWRATFLIPPHSWAKKKVVWKIGIVNSYSCAQEWRKFEFSWRKKNTTYSTTTYCNFYLTASSFITCGIFY